MVFTFPFVFVSLVRVDSFAVAFFVETFPAIATVEVDPLEVAFFEVAFFDVGTFEVAPFELAFLDVAFTEVTSVQAAFFVEAFSFSSKALMRINFVRSEPWKKVQKSSKNGCSPFAIETVLKYVNAISSFSSMTRPVIYMNPTIA